MAVATALPNRAEKGRAGGNHGDAVFVLAQRLDRELRELGIPAGECERRSEDGDGSSGQAAWWQDAQEMFRLPLRILS